MRKNKRGRSRRGGYWFYPSPGDDEHAFTKLRNKFSTGSWKFWQKQPEEVVIAPVSSDYPPAEEPPMPEQAQGSLEYPSSETNQPIDNQEEAPMEPSPPMDNQEASMDPTPPMDNQEAPVEETPETPTGEQELKGGRRRRRQKRTTKKRKRSNMRRRTNKRRRSSKRRSR